MKIKIIFAAALTTLAIGLAGCTANTKNNSGTTTATTTAVTKTASDYVKGLDARSLTADDQKELDVSSLDKAVVAKNAVSFTGESGVKMILLQFETQDQAMTAQNYYMNQDMKTHANLQLLLVAERTMGKEWFEKYQKGIFQQ